MQGFDPQPYLLAFPAAFLPPHPRRFIRLARYETSLVRHGFMLVGPTLCADLGCSDGQGPCLREQPGLGRGYPFRFEIRSFRPVDLLKGSEQAGQIKRAFLGSGQLARAARRVTMVTKGHGLRWTLPIGHGWVSLYDTISSCGHSLTGVGQFMKVCPGS